jgi:class 3 adenylate cyclase
MATPGRDLTVVFCDLVGSTELSTRLDSEDYGKPAAFTTRRQPTW